MMKRMPCSSCLVSAYRIPRRSWRYVLRRIVLAAEGGERFSLTLRDMFKRYHGVDVAAYSYGGCFVPWACDPGTTVGRYSSLARTLRILNRNHPLDARSTHAFFFNSAWGIVDTDSVEHLPVTIGSDVWIGHGAIVLPGVSRIGHGAVVGAGTVLTHDVPPYAVVVGNPARVIRLRFPEAEVSDLLAAEWWEKDLDELDLADFRVPAARRAD